MMLICYVLCDTLFFLCDPLCLNEFVFLPLINTKVPIDIGITKVHKEVCNQF
jgi:hypothetical protein